MSSNANTVLRDLRIAAGLTQRDLAIAVGVSQSTIARLEADKDYSVLPVVVQAIANVLNVNPEQLCINVGDNGSRRRSRRRESESSQSFCPNCFTLMPLAGSRCPYC